MENTEFINMTNEQQNMKQLADAMIGRHTTLNIGLGSLDVRLTGTLLGGPDGGYCLLVEEGKTYAVFGVLDVHYIDPTTNYIATNFAKGFIEYLPVEENEWPAEIK